MTDIHDIKPIVGNSVWEYLMPLILGIILVIVLSLIIFFVYKKIKKWKSRKPKPNPPPKYNIEDDRKKALEALDALENYVRNAEPVDYKYVYFHISSISRRYIGIHTQINGKAKTKTELKYLNYQVLDEVLLNCYLVEFAANTPSKEFTLRVLNQVKIFIAELK